MKMIKMAIFIPLVIASTACQVINIEGDGVPDRHGLPETIHSSYYGFNWCDYDEVKASSQQGLYRVRVSDSYLNALVGVVSLGLYKPITIEYWTAKEIERKEVDVELWEPDGDE